MTTTPATPTTRACRGIEQRLERFVDGALPEDERRGCEVHLLGCPACRERARRHAEIRTAMQTAFTAGGPGGSDLQAKAGEWVSAVSGDEVAEFAETLASERPGRSWLSLFSSAPWWMVSACLHVLVIALAGLVTMAIELPRSDDSVIMVTELQARPNVADDSKQEKADVSDVLAPKVTATDLTAEASNISVPKDILDKAELSDHFETINPELPDTHSAYGNPDSTSFHSVTGNADAAGGGGTGGIGMEDVIGIGAGGTKGTGGANGGWGGGDGSGVGTGTGAGKGSFGQRQGGGRKLLVKRMGGTPATESAVDRGLEWLARNQEADGHWDSGKFGAKTRPGDEPMNPDTVDSAVTGFALLAFVGAGHTEKIGRYKDHVCKAVAWFKGKQDANGAYCKWNYGHAIGLMAMAEAAGMGRIPDTIESAQRGVDCTTGANLKTDTSSDRGGWGYAPQQSRTVNGDLSNSGWAMMALKSAKVAGLKVPFESIEGCRSYLSAVEIGRVAGDTYSGNMFGYAPDPANKGKEPGGRICNAIGLLGRLFFGTPANELENGAENMVKVGGLPGAKGAINEYGLYYIYYGTLVSFQVGGDIWKNWNESLKETLPPRQVKGGADDGSWNPECAYGNHWGRVGQTALSILCMEVYYRYQKLSHGK